MVNELMYAQVSAVLNKMNKEDLEKIPKGLLDTIEQSKDKEAEINLDPKIPLEDQNLSNETIAMLALLNYKYWADDNERESLKAKYEENDRIKEKELREKYHTDDIFGNKAKEEEKAKAKAEEEAKKVEKQQETSLIEMPEPIYVKIIKFFKELFHIK
jgi:hypothetical protein